jgi:hypothetical protein
MAGKKRITASPQNPGGTRDMKALPMDEGGYTQFGATGLKQYSGYVREEWLKDLIGRRGLLMYREMRDNDPIIGAIFFAIEMLLRGVSFHVEAGDQQSQDAADFIESCLGDMEESWPSFLAEVMSFLLYGWDVHEIVYKVRQGKNKNPKFDSKYDDGMIGWRGFMHRGQETLLHWIFDADGRATHLVQLLPTGGPLLQVPLDKCLHFRTTPYKGNPEGRSVFRNAYTPYYFKKVIQEIEAIGVSRDLTGLTVVSVPASWTNPVNRSAADTQAFLMAQQMARDTARNQQEGLVIPIIRNAKDPNLLEFDIKLLATGGRRQFATNDIITRYDNRIAMTVLADFITLGGGSGSGSGRGSYAMSKNKTDIFSVACIAFLDLITAELNRKAIPDLLALNGMKDAKVSLAHGDIQRRDLQELGTYLMDAASAGLLTPDAALEAHIREEGGLPPQNQDSLRDLQDGEGGDPDTPEEQDENDEQPRENPADKNPRSLGNMQRAYAQQQQANIQAGQRAQSRFDQTNPAQPQPKPGQPANGPTDQAGKPMPTKKFATRREMRKLGWGGQSGRVGTAGTKRSAW